MTGHKRLTKILVMSIGCLMLMLVFSGFTSPLYPHYIGLDTAVFFTIAKGFANGKIPYAGLFDHKGPVFYLMYIIGYMTAGRMGVFFASMCSPPCGFYSDREDCLSLSCKTICLDTSFFGFVSINIWTWWHDGGIQHAVYTNRHVL